MTVTMYLRCANTVQYSTYVISALHISHKSVLGLSLYSIEAIKKRSHRRSICTFWVWITRSRIFLYIYFQIGTRVIVIAFRYSRCISALWVTANSWRKASFIMMSSSSFHAVPAKLIEYIIYMRSRLLLLTIDTRGSVTIICSQS